MPRSNTPPLPFINGHLYSFASIEFELDDLTVLGLKRIHYSDNLKPGKIWGTDPVRAGRTPGKADPTLEFECYRADWDAFRAKLTKEVNGRKTFGTTGFNVRVLYFEEAIKDSSGRPVDGAQAQTVTDFIEGCRVTEVKASNDEGTDPTVVLVTCDPTVIRWGGGRDGEGTAIYQNEQAADAFEDNRSFWAANSSGFEGALEAANPWDTCMIAEEKLPGICKVTATPARMVDRQKPNGADASPLILRGYLQPTVEIEMKIWTPLQWARWLEIEKIIWNKPDKSSRFVTEPVPTRVTPGNTLSQQAAANQQNKAAIAKAQKENKAITTGEQKTFMSAYKISHPALAPKGISDIVIESISVPVPGPEPQTFIIKIKAVQYLPFSEDAKNTTRAVKGKKAKLADPKVKTEVQPVNSPKKTPADTQGKP